MKRIQKVAACIAAVIVGLLGTVPDMTAQAQRESLVLGSSAPGVQGQGAPSNNISANNYEIWNTIVNSYLHETENGEMERVEAIDGHVVIEQVTADGRMLLNSTQFAFSLPYFGGCYFGEQYNFLVFADKNMEEDDKKEVLRVERYDKNWSPAGNVSICGATTTTPFVGGSLQMTETDGRLYVYTCHELYRYVDDMIHQANMLFVINEETLQEEQEMCGFLRPEQGCYPHSLNQLICTDGVDIFRIDQGEFYRGVWVTSSETGSDILEVNRRNVMKIPGDYYEIFNKYQSNNTGVSVGGAALSDTSCLVAGNAVDLMESDYNPNSQRNIFVTVTNKGLQHSFTRWITAYNHQEGILPLTPQLVKVDDQSFFLLWEEMQKYTGAVVTKALLIDGEGEQMSDIVELPVRLSDCQPYYGSDGLLHWYTTHHSAPYYYAIDPLRFGEAVPHPGGLGDINGDNTVNSSDAVFVLVCAAKYGTDGDVGLTEAQIEAADVNMDGLINAADATCILRYSAAVGVGKIVEVTDFI